MGAEIGRRLEHRVGNPLQRRVDGQHHVRQPHVREDDPDRPVRVRDPRRRQPEAVQRPVQDAVVREDQPPRVDAHEVARPEREQDQHVSADRACSQVVHEVTVNMFRNATLPASSWNLRDVVFKLRHVG